jgi:hypothetical protein
VADKYTPTTEEVSKAYCDWDSEAFDRWLREIRAKAWDEGELHESRFLDTHGQFCPYKNCNPYREEADHA